MANKTIDQVLKEMQALQSAALNKKTLEWYLRQIRELFVNFNPTDEARKESAKSDEADIKQAVMGQQSTFSVDLLGRMILFRYDPKTKDKLPYYDTFPLVIPLTPSDGVSADIGHSILGLNLHYLPPKERLSLLNSLGTLINKSKDLDEKSRMVVQYKFLKGASRYRSFKPCLKRYLMTHVKSRIFLIHPKEWKQVVMLPVARWEKGSEYQVWTDSLKTIRKTK
jgi:hypothetical protein